MDVGRSYRPLVAVVLISVVACGLAWVFSVRAQSIVRAPGIVHPVRTVDLHSPVNIGRISEVLKADGDTVTLGETLALIDSEDEKLQREAVRKRLVGIQEELKDRERLIELRKINIDLAKANEKEAIAGVEVAKAQLAAANAAVKRAGPDATKVETQIADEKLKYAIKSEEEAKLTYDNYVKILAYDGIKADDVRKAKLAWEKTQSSVREARDELKLLTDSTNVFRLEDAKAEADRRAASVATAQANVVVKTTMIREAEVALVIDERSKVLAADLERYRVEEQRLERLIKEKILRAPVAGVLHEFRIQPGQWISNRTVLGGIYDTSTLIVHAHVQQRDFNKVHPGQKAKITFDGLSFEDGPVEAEVLSLNTLATPPVEDGVSPMAVFQEPVKGAFVPRAVVKLKLPPGPNYEKLRVGFTGAVKIQVGGTKHPLAEWFF